VQVEVYQITVDNQLGPQMNGAIAAPQLILECAPVCGQYRAIVDTSQGGYTAGNYIAKALIPFQQMEVASETLFVLNDPLQPLEIAPYSRRRK
jgi:hypothetical protein